MKHFYTVNMPTFVYSITPYGIRAFFVLFFFNTFASLQIQL